MERERRGKGREGDVGEERSELAEKIPGKARGKKGEREGTGGKRKRRADEGGDECVEGRRGRKWTRRRRGARCRGRG